MDKTVELKDVVYLDKNLWSKIKYELLALEKGENIEGVNLSTFPLYERKPNGTIALNNLITKRPNTILFYDVSDASTLEKEEISKKYDTSIYELPVPIKKVSAYMALLPVLSSEYKSLTADELKMLGSDYRIIEYREGGLKVSKCIISPRGESIPDNLYLKVDFSKMSRELEDKILPILVHVGLNEYGYYNVLDTTIDVKNYGMNK